VADGSQGLEEAAPYDAVVVSAAAPRISEQFTSQLTEGGRLVLPVGSIDAQELQLITKSGRQLSTERLDGCRFVPLIGREGFPT
jgi:protein-L-isoaspartate(D-aspartate) O-methyltransferase